MQRQDARMIIADNGRVEDRERSCIPAEFDIALITCDHRACAPGMRDDRPHLIRRHHSSGWVPRGVDPDEVGIRNILGSIRCRDAGTEHARPDRVGGIRRQGHHDM